ncbi:MAG: patatin-like phospholipase family protein [Bacteroidota bacterium]
MQKKRIGLVCSGGGVRGAAHLGLLQALEEENIEVHCMSGASSGALVAGFYAAGYSPSAILDIFESFPLFHYSHLSFSKAGIINSEKLATKLQAFFKEKNIEELSKKIFISVTDLAKAECQLKDSGPLVNTLLASSALPPLLAPVRIEGRLYGDGGIMNIFPVGPVRMYCDRVIGSFVNLVNPEKQQLPSNPIQYFRRAASLRFYTDARTKFDQCDYLFQPAGIQSVSYVRRAHLKACYQVGYETALRQMDQIKMALEEERVAAGAEMLSQKR